MTIRVSRNEEGNCITFVGSSNPAYWNACLSAVINADDPTRFNIINDIRSSNSDDIQYEFYAVEFADFADKDGNVFTSAQEAVDYVNANANVLGVSDVGIDLNGIDVNFRLDATNTSVIMDNGSAFGVNTIQAVANADGTVHLHAVSPTKPNEGDEANAKKHFEGLEVGRVSVDGTVVAGGLQDVTNTLNELFTVGAFESVVISDPFSTMVADVDGDDAGYTLEGNDAVDPIGDDIFTYDGSGYSNYAGLKSTATIDQAGEYYTFDIRGEGTIGFGLVHTDTSYADGKFQGNSNYANPTNFAAVNSAHYGMQFSHWFHPTPNGSWTNYGALTGYVGGSGWSNWDQKQDWLDGNPVKIKCGLDVNGYISIESLQDDGTWVLHARSNYPVPQGSSFHLGIKSQSTAARVATAPKVHLLEPAAPTMYFRYIESPDGNYQYPLFATEEEANYYDTQEGGSGTSHTHVYVDDPSNTVWYMPDTNSTMTATVLPTSAQTFEGNAINWTPITSLTNADLVPTAFTDASITVDELSAVNYQLSPVDVGYVTTIGGTPNWSLVDGTTLVGTAPEVTGDNVTNPSDTTTVTVYRTNSYGTSSGTLTINITNLTAPIIAPIAGFSHEAASTAMVDADTLGDGSVVAIDNIIDDGNRFIINKEWLDDYVLPKISSGSGTKAVWIGFKSNSANWSSVGASDFDLAYRFVVDDASRAANNFRLQVWTLGATTYNVGVGSLSSGLYDYVLINDDVDVKLGSLVASQGHDASSKVYAVASNSDWNWTGGVTGLTAGNKSIYIATQGTDLDLSGDEFSEVAEPTAPVVTIDTPWTKALDFSGSNEYAKIVSTSSSASALRMGGKSSVVYAPSDLTRASNDSNARPWATVVVFRADKHNSNQHIWNSGEGSSSGDDNIYLRLSASGTLHFGWGRDGALNECSIGNVSTTTGWHGVYIAHNGTRLSGNNATAANLANAFSIRRMGSEWSSPFGSLGSELSTSGNWVTNGGRMDRTVLGDFTIGGRGSNRSFHGKVASMIVTTLKRNQVMPTDAEVELMIKDPVKWLNDYKVGQSYRHPTQSSYYSNFTLNNLTSAVSTSVWLMGDTSMDSYSNMIRNYVQPTDQNFTKLQLNSMVSNDIQTVNINGLT